MPGPDPIATLIPAVRQWQPAAGHFTPDLAIDIRVDDDLDSRLAEGLSAFASSFLRPVFGFNVHSSGAPTLNLGGADDLGGERYRLVIRPDGLTLAAGAREGFARGLATVFQLVAGRDRRHTIPCGTIVDGPAFGWRGLLLDSGRHFQPVPVVLQVIDRLAVYRFNVMHWHLTEDQGWRLEVPGLPLLTTVGAHREQQDGGHHGGFYTAADVRRVVDYAGERGIMVVPEIEMPGHCQAALAAYPRLSCTGGPFAVQTQWGVFPDIYCAGSDEVFTFLETVLGHVLALFPSPFIHVGGDEAPRTRWRACPRCQARLAAEGLKDEHELQSWFIRRMGRWLHERGRRLVGWDEILDGGLAGSLPGAVVQSWRGIDGAVAAARAGHDTIVSPTSHAYLDYDPGVLDLARVLQFDPEPPGLSPREQGHVLGGAANLWTEYAPADRLDRQLFPRLTAMAEALWARPIERDAGAFLARVRGHESVFRALGIGAGNTCRPLRVSGVFDEPGRRHVLRVATEGTLAKAVASDTPDLRFAVLPDWPLWDLGSLARPEDLEIPVEAWSALDSESLEVDLWDGNATVLFQLMVDGLPCGAPEAVELARHRALGRPVVLAPSPDQGEASRLTDGILGSWRRDDGRWFSCAGADLEMTIDLGEPVIISAIIARFLQDANARIFPPNLVSFLLSDDGHAWRGAGDVKLQGPDRRQDKVIVPFSAGRVGTARHVRVRAHSRLTCPDWHPDAGQPAWLCVDQVIVRDDMGPVERHRLLQAAARAERDPEPIRE